MQCLNYFQASLQVLCLAFWCSIPTAQSAEIQQQPNVVLILVDDLGYGDLGCYGSESIRTPRLDRMAASGMKLTSFYAAAPICTPTRAALMTGCYATRVGLPTPLHVYDEIGINESEFTLGEAMQQCGYETVCVGKWHLGHQPRFYPTEHGFNHYWGTPLGHMFNRPAVGKAIGDTSDLFLDDTREIPFPEDADLTERLTEKAVEFIEAKRDRPFFLFLAHPMPHEPLAASEKFADRSQAGLYGDVVECLDWSTGEVLDALERTGQAENTLVAFLSDNGPKKGHGTTAGLRGFKHDPYEGGMRVPCIIAAPGLIPAGQTSDEICNVMDWYPTLVNLAGGTTVSEQVRDGKNLTPLLTGETAAGPHDEFFYFVRHGVLAGVRRGPMKLLKHRQAVELFNLQEDPAESRNLAKQQPQLVQELSDRMDAFAAEVEASRRPAAGEKNR